MVVNRYYAYYYSLLCSIIELIIGLIDSTVNHQICIEIRLFFCAEWNIFALNVCMIYKNRAR